MWRSFSFMLSSSLPLLTSDLDSSFTNFLNVLQHSSKRHLKFKKLSPIQCMDKPFVNPFDSILTQLYSSLHLNQPPPSSCIKQFFSLCHQPINTTLPTSTLIDKCKITSYNYSRTHHSRKFNTFLQRLHSSFLKHPHKNITFYLSHSKVYSHMDFALVDTFYTYLPTEVIFQFYTQYSNLVQPINLLDPLMSLFIFSLMSRKYS
ncbi:hypothetical protein HMI56_005138 [Coelomomyces lativittatus]|nr:hypothetical protein HMI56_005138 [Coelomomyces lativittatus]